MFKFLLKSLTVRELYVLQQRRAGRTLKTIGDDLSITRNRVWQLECQALRKERSGATTNLRDISLEEVRSLRRLPDGSYGDIITIREFECKSLVEDFNAGPDKT